MVSILMIDYNILSLFSALLKSASEETEKEISLNLLQSMITKVVNIAYAMIKLQFKLPQTLISRGFTRRTVLHAPALQQKGINRLMDIYQIW